MPSTQVKERPILFSAPMVRAILDGSKSQTRRTVKNLGVFVDSEMTMRPPEPYHAKPGRFIFDDGTTCLCPYGTVGQQLWVREAFYIDHCDYLAGPLGSNRPADVDDDCLFYPADARGTGAWCCQVIPECCCAGVGKPRVRSARFMPRWASRITLEITKVRVERLNEISEANVWAEGAISHIVPHTWRKVYREPAERHRQAIFIFKKLWESINGDGSWDANPWVWAISFRRVSP